MNETSNSQVPKQLPGPGDLSVYVAADGGQCHALITIWNDTARGIAGELYVLLPGFGWRQIVKPTPYSTDPDARGVWHWPGPLI